MRPLKLTARLKEDLKRPHYRKHVFISALWEDDKEALLVLPVTPFDVFRLETAMVNRVSEIQLDGEPYHVPGASWRQQVLVKIYPYHIEVFDKHGEVKLGQNPRKYAFDVEKVNWARELAVFKNKPRAIEQATYLKALPEQLRKFLLPTSLKERSERVRTLIALFEAGFSVEEVEKAVDLALEYGRTDLASIKATAGHGVASKAAATMLPELHTPEVVRDWRPNLDLYTLLAQGVVGGES